LPKIVAVEAVCPNRTKVERRTTDEPATRLLAVSTMVLMTDPVGTALFLGIFVGICMTCGIILVALGLIFSKKEATSLCEGSVTHADDTEIENEHTIRVLFYEFHIPASADHVGEHIVGAFGAKVTGKVEVSTAKYSVHKSGLPKACTIRYAAADPRVNRLVAIGDDEDPSHGGPDAPWRWFHCALAFILSFGWLAGALNPSQISWPSSFFEGVAWAFVGIFMTCGAVRQVRIKLRLPPFPWSDQNEQYKGFDIVKLGAPYPIPVPQANPLATAEAPAASV
jgi:hypothetical protein